MRVLMLKDAAVTFQVLEASMMVLVNGKEVKRINGRKIHIIDETVIDFSKIEVADSFNNPLVLRDNMFNLIKCSFEKIEQRKSFYM